MPTYQYACTACDERLEAVQTFTDAALTDCPVCGGALRKVFSAVGVVFKGSGFYKNDSRDSPKKAPAAKETVTAGSSGGDSSGGGSSGGDSSGRGSSSDASSSSVAASSSPQSSSSGSSSGADGKAAAKKAPAATPAGKSA